MALEDKSAVTVLWIFEIVKEFMIISDAQHGKFGLQTLTVL